MEIFWKVAGGFTSLFVPAKPVSYSVEQYKEILFSEGVQQTEEKFVVEEGSETTCQRRVGKITRLEPNYGLIDDKFYFEIADLNQKNVKTGQAVRYIAYRSDPNVEWRIKQVDVVVKDEWIEDESVALQSVVTSETVAVQKSITALILKRSGRDIVMDPGGIRCNLDRIKADFLPMEGDWVSLTAIVELRENEDHMIQEHVIEVQLLKPLRQRRFDGRVSCVRHVSGSEFEGTVNSEVYFNQNVCESGYVPSTNDLVVVNCIESTQGSLVWRAVAVNLLTSPGAESSFLAKIKEQRLFDSKNGIHVTESCDKKSIVMGEKTTFEVTVENSGNIAPVLLDAALKNSQKTHVMKILTNLKDPVSIAPSSCFKIEVEATGRFSGYFSDVLTLHFDGDWKIGCMLDIYVDIEETFKSKRECPTQNETRSRYDKYAKRNTALKKLVPTKMGFVVPGVRPVKPTSFVPKQLPHYEIPDFLRSVFVGDDPDGIRRNSDIAADLVNTMPFVVEELNEKNYLQKFHTLLHMEDLELLLAIKKYDKDRACFSRRGDYLVLEIPNLAESRPSLVVGDKLLAEEPLTCNKEGGIKYEGYIHKVHADSIKLKFNGSFHNAYDGRDYSISFQHSRTSVRRCHQALNEVFHHLGKSFLFPNTLGSVKAPQVTIIGEYPLSNAKADEHVCEGMPKKEGEGTPRKENEGTPRKIIANPDALKKKQVTPNGATKKRMQLTDFSIESGESTEITEALDNSNGRDSNTEAGTPPQSLPAVATPHGYTVLSSRSTKEPTIRWEEDNRLKSRARGTQSTPPSRPKENGIKPRDVILKWVNPVLNHHQREAVRNILKGVARPLPYVIFGPPGTGKTVTVVETVLQIMYLMPESRILIATPSNSSADLICERLLSWNLLKSGDLVRLVGYNYILENRISPTLKPYCTCLDTKNTDRNTAHTSYDEDGIKFSTRQVIGRHRITVSTCVSVGVMYMMGFPKNHFTHIIIDEAGQATEPEVMIPLAFLSQDNQAILAGDPRQLGPVIMSKVADDMGLGESLLSRLLIRFPYHRDPEGYPDTGGYDPRLVTQLLYNYRSLPNILHLYSALFYESTLVPQICDSCSLEAKLLNKVRDAVQENAWHKVSEVIFHGVKGINLQDDESPSWYNDHEIARILRYISSLYACGLKPEDIGIITPYQKQVAKIRELSRAMLMELPKVGTVEEFQGQERNVIILSTVRSDEGLLERDSRFALGFVSSKQRLNVAISRARALLIIVGNPHLLAKDVSWRNLLRKCKEKECCVGCDLPSSLD